MRNLKDASKEAKTDPDADPASTANDDASDAVDLKNDKLYAGKDVIVRKILKENRIDEVNIEVQAEVEINPDVELHPYPEI